MNPWPALVRFPGPSTFPQTWRKYLGEAFEPFSAAFFEPKPKTANSMFCQRCGCRHRIMPEPDGSFTAHCDCDPPACEPMRLTLQEITALQLSWSKLGRALCRALALDPKPQPLNLENTEQIGSWSTDAIPAILTIQFNEYQFRFIVADLVARLHKPFILLAPTSEPFDANTDELLHHARAACFALEATVQLTQEGKLLPLKAPGELFAQFRPEPRESVAEETARQVWALARTLDAASAVRKAPPFRVFLFYCVDGLSAGQIARQCHCSRPVVFARLKWLRHKLGCSLESLRQYSGHFQKMEDSLSDPRARRIDRKTAAFGEADQEEN